VPPQWMTGPAPSTPCFATCAPCRPIQVARHIGALSPGQVSATAASKQHCWAVRRVDVSKTGADIGVTVHTAAPAIMTPQMPAGPPSPTWTLPSRHHPSLPCHYHSVTKPFAYLTIGMMLASALGAPLATGFLAMDGIGGLRGWQVKSRGERDKRAVGDISCYQPAAKRWLDCSCNPVLLCSHCPPAHTTSGPVSQWLYLLEGLPWLLLAGPVLWLVPDRVSNARFLTPREREALEAEIARSKRDVPQTPAARPEPATRELLRAALRNGYLWICCLAGMFGSVPTHTYSIYTPVVIANLLKGTALSSNATVAASSVPAGAGIGASGLLPVALSIVPFALAVAASYVVAASSQRTDEVFWHVAVPFAAAGAVLALFPPLARASAIAGLASLSLSLALSVAGNGPALTLLLRICEGPEQVLAMPLFSTFSTLGGVAGPLVTCTLMYKAVSVVGARRARPVGGVQRAGNWR
jgi:hypothetical protein